MKKNLENISGTYVSPGSGCVGQKHSIGYVELVFGCNRYFFAGNFPISEFSKKRGGGLFSEQSKIVGFGF